MRLEADILIVDHNKFFQMVAARNYQNNGLTTKSVSCGVDCINLIQKGAGFKCITMGGCMEMLTGVETILRLRSLGYTGMIVGVIGSPDKTPDFLNAGATECIVKGGRGL